ncbi:MAG: hypothetical protein LBE38_00970 [Deltaproteobacteria bacterium]|jgi:hypothetical protein|nr:hypothetical protein [Deltaproteobacteria bacterium]
MPLSIIYSSIFKGLAKESYGEMSIISCYGTIKKILSVEFQGKYESSLAEPIEKPLSIDWVTNLSGDHNSYEDLRGHLKDESNQKISSLIHDFTALGSKLVEESSPEPRFIGKFFLKLSSKIAGVLAGIEGPLKVFFVGDKPVLAGWGLLFKAPSNAQKVPITVLKPPEPINPFPEPGAFSQPIIAPSTQRPTLEKPKSKINWLIWVLISFLSFLLVLVLAVLLFPNFRSSIMEAVNPSIDTVEPDTQLALQDAPPSGNGTLTEPFAEDLPAAAVPPSGNETLTEPFAENLPPPAAVPQIPSALSFLEGCWVSESGIADSRDHNTIFYTYCFDNKGRATVSLDEYDESQQPIGTCSSVAKATLEGDTLKIRDGGLSCPHGGDYLPTTVICQSSDSLSQCTVQGDGQVDIQFSRKG